jgi:hypothetical protein
VGAKLRIAPQAIDAESMTVGDVATAAFVLANDGDAPVTIEKSKPPTSAAFQAQSPLDEGTVIAPGASVEVLIRVSPTEVGVNSDVWQINANDGQGLRLVTMAVTGVARPAAAAPTTTGGTPDGAASTSAPLTAAADGGAPVAGEASGGCSLGGAPRPGLRGLGLALALTALVSRRRRVSSRHVRAPVRRD